MTKAILNASIDYEKKVRVAELSRKYNFKISTKINDLFGRIISYYEKLERENSKNGK